MRTAREMEGSRKHADTVPPSIGIVYLTSMLCLKPFCHWVLSGSERLSAALYRVYWRLLGDQQGAPNASSTADESKFQMRSTQSRCSGFMSTDRRQVIASRSRFIAPRFASQKRTGNSATARCRSCLAAASNIFRLKTETSLTL